MGDAIIEVIFHAVFEAIPKCVGTFIRWCFYLGKKKFKVVFEEDWNKRVGLLAIVIGIVIYVYW